MVSRALQKLETVEQASREALRCDFQGAGGWRPVRYEVSILLGQGQVNYSPPSCMILFAASDNLEQILSRSECPGTGTPCVDGARRVQR